MELAIVENKIFANKTLTVSKDIEPSGKITLNKEGQVELPKAAADILCGIDGFKIVGGSGEPNDKTKKAPAEKLDPATDKNSLGAGPQITDQNLINKFEEAADNNMKALEQMTSGQEQETAKKYPEGEPTSKWTKEELVAWLKEQPGIEFDEKENKAVLIGKIFKHLESAQQNGGQGAQGNGESAETKTE